MPEKGCQQVINRPKCTQYVPRGHRPAVMVPCGKPAMYRVGRGGRPVCASHKGGNLDRRRHRRMMDTLVECARMRAAAERVQHE